MEAQETPQIEQEAQTPKKRELALVSRSTYLKEKALQWIFFACAFLAVVTVILIFVFTTYSALPVFTDIGLADFFSFTWAPSEGHYGIVSLLAGSGLVTVGALAMGVPLGVGTAVYLVEIASKRVRKLISPAVDLLAGIPSIIYGFFGMIIIRPFIAQLTGGLGFGALTAWFVLAIMIVPTITTLTIGENSRSREMPTRATGCGSPDEAAGCSRPWFARCTASTNRPPARTARHHSSAGRPADASIVTRSTWHPTTSGRGRRGPTAGTGRQPRTTARRDRERRQF